MTSSTKLDALRLRVPPLFSFRILLTKFQVIASAENLFAECKDPLELYDIAYQGLSLCLLINLCLQVSHVASAENIYPRSTINDTSARRAPEPSATAGTGDWG
jgi:hypothetical protein